MLKEREKVINSFIAVLDALVGIASFTIALILFYKDHHFVDSSTFQLLFVLIFFIWFFLSKSFNLSLLHRSRPMSALLFSCIRLSFLGTILLGIIIYFLNLTLISTKIVQYFLPINLVLTFAFKSLLYLYMRRARKKGKNTRTILVLGDETAASFIELLLKHKEWGYILFGVIGDVKLHKQFENKVTFLADNTDVAKLLEDKVIDELAFCKGNPSIKEVEEMAFICSEVGVTFRMYSPFFNMFTNKAHLHYFDTMPMLTLSKVPGDYLAQSVKVAFDFVFSFLVLVCLFPLFLVIASIVKLTSKGPVFFKQERVGLMGRRFQIYKFRTMVVGAEKLMENLLPYNEADGPTFKMERDPRITRIGKFLRKTSLDELPQFINVLKGDMSIVGPRPPVPAEVVRYERWQLRRLSMKPGITCIWQVTGRNIVSFDTWMEMDLEYIDNWSLKMDFIIFLKTIRAVIVANGR